MPTPGRPSIITAGRVRRRILESPRARTGHQQVSTMAASAQPSSRRISKLASSVTPEQCKLEMSAAAFRTWRLSVEGWLVLSGYNNAEAVIHTRLLCAPALQRVLDTRLVPAQWMTIRSRDLLDVIGKIVTKASSQAVRWADFFDTKQSSDEKISEYIARCAQDAADCDFECSKCKNNMTNYMLVRKVMAGIYDTELRREVFRKCDVLSEIDKLREFCEIWEAARNDAAGPGARLAAVDPVWSDVTEDESPEQVAATRADGTNRKKCYYCGKVKCRRGRKCLAWGKKCSKCDKLNHFAAVCQSQAKKEPETTEVSSVLVASLADESQPRINVSVKCEARRAEVLVIPDTGAQVCVAGPELPVALGVQPRALGRRVSLRDVAQRRLRCTGALSCELRLAGRTSKQEVIIAPDLKNLYISKKACVELGLVPHDFPNPLPLAAAGIENATTENGNREEIVVERPAVIPYQPLEENAAQLEQWLLRHFSDTTFNTDRVPLRVMKGAPHHIHLKENAKPVACHTPAAVPKHWQAEVKKQLDEDVRAGVIAPVPAGEATEWCSRMVVVAKKTGKPRRTVDFQPLNKCCKRETHHTPTPFDMVSDVPPHAFKTVVDAHWGFHQVELDEASRPLTTFITPWGRYQYCRTPMGHCSATDAYTKRFDDAIAGFPRKHKCVDDTLLYDGDIETAFWHTYDFLALCADKGITLKPEKFKFARREVEFVGFHLTWEAFRPTEDRLRAIKSFNMPAEPTVTDVRSWFGFINQLAPFLATAPVMAPFRELLKKNPGKKVYWDKQLEAKLEQAKDTICKLAEEGLAYYDRTRPTAVVTDWSREGVGFVVLQQYCTCVSPDSPFCCKGGWRLALCGSRHLTKAEAAYAPVEGEALAVAWCLRKARLFLLGCPNLVIVTDHRPLVGLLGSKALADIANPRLLRLKEKTLAYRFTIRHLPGKRNCAADFLSRYPAMKAAPEEEDLDLEEEIASVTSLATVAALSAVERVTMDEEMVVQAARNDLTYQALLAKVMEDSWLDRRSKEVTGLRPYFNIRDRLGAAEGLVTYAFDQGHLRLVIPECLRAEVTASLHAGHQGLDSMLRRARQTVYWPGMEGDLQRQRDRCNVCNLHAPAQAAEPLLMTPPPDYPFQQTAMDLCSLEGHTYLVYADRLSGWIEVAHLPDGASSGAIRDVLRRSFMRWGAPEVLSTDGGTNLVSDDMRAFYQRWAVRLRVSSAHYPQSNGRAEAAVKSAKRTLRSNVGADGDLDNDQVSRALMQYLNTPLQDVDKSPAELALGRQLRGGVPTAKRNLLVDGTWAATLRERERTLARRGARREVATEARRSLPPIAAGQRVLIFNEPRKTWDRTGVVVEVMQHRQYLVRLDGSGRMSLRTRRHLRPSSVRPEAAGDSVPQSQDQHINPPTQPARATPSPERPPPTPISPPSQPHPRVRRRRPPRWMQDYVDE